MGRKLTSNSVVSIVIAFVFAAWQSQASAAPADSLIKEGLELRRAGRDTDALAKFESAYALSKAPRAAAQWGLCLQAVSRWSEADPLLAEALSAAHDPWVKKNRETLKESLETVKAHVGRIEVLGGPVGASVSVAGKVVGTFPLPGAVTVNEGVVDVEVTAEGHDPAVRSITSTGASYQRLVIRLKKSAVGPQAPLPVSVAEPVPAAEPSGTLTASTATSDEPRPITKNPWFWAGTAAVVAGVVLGVVLLTSGSPADPKFDQTTRFE